MNKIVSLGLFALAFAILFAGAARAEVSNYKYAMSVPTFQVDLASDPQAIRIANNETEDGKNTVRLNVGGFTLPFYNLTADTFYLSTNGILIFNEQQRKPYPRPNSLTCPFPLTVRDSGDNAEYAPLFLLSFSSFFNSDHSGVSWRSFFDYGFVVGWGDYEWSTHPESSIYYRVFEAGSCPFSFKSEEACLIFQLNKPHYYGSDGYFGDVTAVAFESGDFYGQVVFSTNSSWGVDSEPPSGSAFGISNLPGQRGLGVPEGEQYCSAMRSDGWDAVEALNIPGLARGQTFTFYIGACNENQKLNSNGIGCVSPASSVSAAWIEALRGFSALF